MSYEEIVNHTQKLAKLEIASSEKKNFSEQIGKILHFVEKLNELNTEGIEPTSHGLPVHNVTRKDCLNPSFDKETYLRLSPLHDQDFILVPPVIQEE